MTLDEGPSVRLRTYEKGVEDETPSCGTGVLAAASVAQQIGRTRAADRLRVQTNGGALHVGRAPVAGNESVYLEGPVVFVFDGQIPFPDGTQ
jgi:diaminopimelate epimerase